MEFRKLNEGILENRVNRFLARIKVDDKFISAHVANSGRLPGLLEPGMKVWFGEVEQGKRKTRYDLILVQKENILVSIDARLPNKVVEEAIIINQIPNLKYSTIRREVKLGNSRMDFCLTHRDQLCWIETKSVTQVLGDTATFPDAPTERGWKHLVELEECIERGDKAAVFFVVQRMDANQFRPNLRVDPKFSRKLEEIHERGVEVRSFACRVTLSNISIANEIDCLLSSKSELFDL